MLEFSGLENLKGPFEINHSQTPYILCNEEEQKATLEKVSKRAESTLDQGISMHLGFSVWFNLDLLAINKAQYAIVLDIDPKVVLIYEKLQLCFREAHTPREFINLFYKELSKDDRLLQFPKEYQLQFLEDQLSKNYGFLSSQEKFLRVKNMSEENRIFFGKADITSETQMMQIATWCEKNNARIDTFYLSNIPEWIFENGTKESKSALKLNLEALTAKNTCVIDAFYSNNKKNTSGPPQRITEGSVPVFIKKIKHKKNHHHATRKPKRLNFTLDDFELRPMSDLTFLSMPTETKKPSSQNKLKQNLTLFEESVKENLSPNRSSLASPKNKLTITPKKHFPLVASSSKDLKEISSPPKKKQSRSETRQSLSFLPDLEDDNGSYFADFGQPIIQSSLTQEFGIFSNTNNQLTNLDKEEENSNLKLSKSSSLNFF